MKGDPKYWFHAKRYGWGWGLPVAWQGWLVLATFLALFAASSLAFPPATKPELFIGCVALLSAALIVVCYAKGQPPRWRWGNRR